MTISEQITAGIKEAFNGTVSADLATMTKERDSEKSRADKAASDLAAMTRERDAEKSRADKAAADLAAAQAEVTTLKAEVAKLTGAKGQADAKAVDDAAAKKAAALAAAAGQPPVPGAKEPQSPAASGDLLEQRAALKTPQEKAEFDKKHYQALFDLARVGIRKERAESR